MSTATSVGVQTETRVRTAVHLTDAIMGTFSHILAHLGLRSAYLNEHWTTIEVGLKTWIAEGSLEAVRLECGARRYCPLGPSKYQSRPTCDDCEASPSCLVPTLH